MEVNWIENWRGLPTIIVSMSVDWCVKASMKVPHGFRTENTIISNLTHVNGNGLGIWKCENFRNFRESSSLSSSWECYTNVNCVRFIWTFSISIRLIVFASSRVDSRRSEISKLHNTWFVWFVCVIHLSSSACLAISHHERAFWFRTENWASCCWSSEKLCGHSIFVYLSANAGGNWGAKPKIIFIFCLRWVYSMEYEWVCGCVTCRAIAWIFIWIHMFICASALAHARSQRNPWVHLVCIYLHFQLMHKYVRVENFQLPPAQILLMVVFVVVAIENIDNRWVPWRFIYLLPLLRYRFALNASTGRRRNEFHRNHYDVHLFRNYCYFHHSLPLSLRC